MSGRRARPPARAASPARADRPQAYPDTAADETLAATLISMWELASGRRLPRHVPPNQLSTEELIAFWADDLSRAVGRHAAHIPGYDQQTVLDDILELAKDQPIPMLAFDVVGFTRPDRDQEVRRHIHKMLYEMLGEALEESGIPQDRCYYTGRGDGPLLLVPLDIPAHRIINPFPGLLSESIRVYNKVSCPAAQIQVRAAAHIGTVYRDKHDLVSDDINLLFRMLNAKPLKTDLERTGAGLALFVSGYMYDSLVRLRPSLIGPGSLRHVRTTAKGTKINAWIHVPGAPQPLQRRRAVPVVSVSWAHCRRELPVCWPARGDRDQTVQMLRAAADVGRQLRWPTCWLRRAAWTCCAPGRTTAARRRPGTGRSAHGAAQPGRASRSHQH
jgi:hypothetical protein